MYFKLEKCTVRQKYTYAPAIQKLYLFTNICRTATYILACLVIDIGLHIFVTVIVTSLECSIDTPLVAIHVCRPIKS